MSEAGVSQVRRGFCRCPGWNARLARARLAVGKDCAIVAHEDLVERFLHNLVPEHALVGLGSKDFVKRVGPRRPGRRSRRCEQRERRRGRDWRRLDCQRRAYRAGCRDDNGRVLGNLLARPAAAQGETRMSAPKRVRGRATRGVEETHRHRTTTSMFVPSTAAAFPSWSSACELASPSPSRCWSCLSLLLIGTEPPVGTRSRLTPPVGGPPAAALPLTVRPPNGAGRAFSSSP